MSCRLIVTQSGNLSKNGLLFDWLNKQLNDSVVYVSFRSGATLLHEQMIDVSFFNLEKCIFCYYLMTVTILMSHHLDFHLNFYLFLI